MPIHDTGALLVPVALVMVTTTCTEPPAGSGTPGTVVVVVPEHGPLTGWAPVTLTSHVAGDWEVTS
jgi:hypothetical protein